MGKLYTDTVFSKQLQRYRGQNLNRDLHTFYYTAIFAKVSSSALDFPLLFCYTSNFTKVKLEYKWVLSYIQK
jgi:hypothetical protein